VNGIALALLGGYGVFLLYTASRMQWRGLRVGPSSSAARHRPARLREWLVGAGLDDVRPVEFAAVIGVLFTLATAIAYAVFGGAVAAVVTGAFAASAPVGSHRARRARRQEKAGEAWPAMIEEIRLQTGSLGRPVPQALLDVGARGPVELRPAFSAARREWLLTTDFERTIAVLKAHLADSGADAACETLLVAHEVGGNELDRRLAALAEDRTADIQERKDARARQAGARFARWFTVVVPFGMALAGLSIGDGRDAYATSAGQLVAAVGVALVVICWLWAGRIMRLPEEERVFHG
jgi:tight adherence protein B